MIAASSALMAIRNAATLAASAYMLWWIVRYSRGGRG